MPMTIDIYTKDKWNKIVAILHGRTIEIIEIDEQWGEHAYVFAHRSMMMSWARTRFATSAHDDATRQHILDALAAL